MKTQFAGLILGTAFLVLGSPPGMAGLLSRDPLMDMVLRQQLGIRTMGDNMVDALEYAGKAAGAKMEGSLSIAKARQKYWALYPDRPGFAEAEAEYAKLLNSKDFYYLQKTVLHGRPDPNILMVEIITGGDIDSGIPPGAQRAFRAWVDDIRSRLGVKSADDPSILTKLPKMRNAISNSGETYRAYIYKRTLEDFRAAGRTPPGFDPLHWQIVALMVDKEPWITGGDPEYLQIRHWLSVDPYDTAKEIYERTVKLLGEDHVKNVAAKVFAAQGDITAPPEVGDWQDSEKLHALLSHWGSGDAKRFLLGQLRQDHPDEEQADWKKAEEKYNNLVRSYGEIKVLEAAKRLEVAKKTSNLGQYGFNVMGYHFTILLDPASVGCRNKYPNRCIDEILAANGTPEKIRGTDKGGVQRVIPQSNTPNPRLRSIKDYIRGIRNHS